METFFLGTEGVSIDCGKTNGKAHFALLSNSLLVKYFTYTFSLIRIYQNSTKKRNKKSIQTAILVASP